VKIQRVTKKEQRKGKAVGIGVTAKKPRGREREGERVRWNAGKIKEILGDWRH